MHRTRTNIQQGWLHFRLCIRYSLHLLQVCLATIHLGLQMIISWAFMVNTFADIAIIWAQVDTGEGIYRLNRWQRVQLAAYLSEEAPSINGACCLLGYDDAEKLSWCAIVEGQKYITRQPYIWHIMINVGAPYRTSRVQWLRDKINVSDNVEPPFGSLRDIHRCEGSGT